MLDSALLILMNGLLLMLRLAPGDSFPKPLNAVEEREYLTAWEERGDMEARNMLVEHNLRLVAHIIKKYYTQDEDGEDLISIGTIGLIKGINTYRSDKGVRLATYASRCIENEILMHFRAQKKSAGDVSLSDTIDVDGEGNGLSVMDVVCYEDDIDERISGEELCRTLRESIDKILTPREAEIIHLRYGLNGAEVKTQQEAAAICGISRSYVSRIEKKALEKLRELMDDN